MDLKTKLNEACTYITSKTEVKPQTAIILGSGLGMLTEDITEAVEIPYGEVPHFPKSNVIGHAGELILGYLDSVPVMVMSGRFHLYEGHGGEAVTFPIRVMQRMGIARLLVTNAAGGINEEFSRGSFMLIRDHINQQGYNPLIGPNDEAYGPRFPDMSEAYDMELRNQVKQVAQKLGILMEEGVYVAVLGPSYETPAEIKMLRGLGADAVGMSTVAEVLVARHAGIRVVGISLITNMAAGILPQKQSHEEVMEAGEMAKDKFVALVRQVVKELK